ncbi:MAG TPA: citrate synthase/methylcitrate synthase [Bacillales bacterium]|nr:citrate synthase/methylcitrate synthase [Bacillales bacterium]
MEYRPGLEGIVAAETALSLIDGENGGLLFRGHPAGELARNRSFEEAAYFLWYGSFPDAEKRAGFSKSLAGYRHLPAHVKHVIDHLPDDMEIMAVLRTAISAFGVVDTNWPPTVDEAMQLAAAMPTILAYHWRKQNDKAFVPPREDLGHTENYLYMLTGKEPDESHVRALNAYLVMTMEHGLNASTFAARVITSTESDLVSAVTGAIGAMKGPLHGGAPSGVIHMLNAIQTKENAEPWLRRALENNERLMGFGHRVYKTEDPRASALRDVTAKLSEEDAWFALANHVEETAIRLLEEYKPGRRLYTNVEFYAAAILRAVQLPTDLYTPTFSASRVVGWTAHILEQAENNRIFRPKAAYTGPRP